MPMRLGAAVVVMATACFGCVLIVATLSVTNTFAPADATAHLGFVLAVPSSIIVTCGRLLCCMAVIAST